MPLIFLGLLLLVLGGIYLATGTMPPPQGETVPMSAEAQATSQWFDEKARAVKGDFRKLSAADRAKANEISRGAGERAIRGSWQAQSGGR
jgi:hypothetical protein